jgi:predicted transcriptional regulator
MSSFEKSVSFIKFVNMKKAAVISVLNELPREFSFDDFLDRLMVIEKIEAGLKDAKAGKTLSHDEVKKSVAKWLK